MTMRNQGLVKTFNTGAAVARSRIVKFGADERTVVVGAASTDLLIGVSDDVAAPATGDVVDVVLSGVATVEYGGTVAAGAYLTSDATGRAVAAAPGAGVNAAIIGIAMVAGVVGDLGAVLLSPGRIQG
ncbi:MAG: DUF2190 domain-containing protein [Burkholderiaceae bacterium]|jgi:hypothetical protein|nr:DUF2190 domain-containing protein [Burkholderiaceae bacterium]